MQLEHLCSGCDRAMHVLASALLAVGLVASPARPLALEEVLEGISPLARINRELEPGFLSARSARSQTGAVGSSVLEVASGSTAASEACDQIELVAVPSAGTSRTLVSSTLISTRIFSGGSKCCR